MWPRRERAPVHLLRSHQPGPWKGNQREESHEVFKYSESAGWRGPQPACQTIGSVSEGDLSFTIKCLLSPIIHTRHDRLKGHELEQTRGESEGQTGQAGVLQSMGSQRVGHHLATEQQGSVLGA